MDALQEFFRRFVGGVLGDEFRLAKGCSLTERPASESTRGRGGREQDRHTGQTKQWLDGVQLQVHLEDSAQEGVEQGPPSRRQSRRAGEERARPLAHEPWPTAPQAGRPAQTGSPSPHDLLLGQVHVCEPLGIQQISNSWSGKLRVGRRFLDPANRMKGRSSEQWIL